MPLSNLEWMILSGFSGGLKDIMHSKLFESALGVGEPWFAKAVSFDAAAKQLTIGIDFTSGSGFPVPGAAGVQPAHDIVVRRYPASELRWGLSLSSRLVHLLLQSSGPASGSRQ